jgi:hypothetical protein
VGNQFGGGFSGVNPGVVTGAVDTPWLVTISPTIQRLSYNRTGLGGGSELVITGTGFSSDPERNSVRVSGVPCRVTAASPQQLRCRPGVAEPGVVSTFATAAAPLGAQRAFPFENSSYPSGRGLMHRVFSGLPSGYADARTTFAATPVLRDFVNTDSVQGYSYNANELNYMQELLGYFVPPITANYSFYCRSDDWSAMYQAPSERRSQLVKVLDVSFWGTHYAHAGPAQISPSLFREAGKRYLTSFRHQQGWGGEFFDCALRIHTTENPAARDAAAALGLVGPSQRSRAVAPEIQRLDIRVDKRRETQVVSILGAVEGTWGLEFMDGTTFVRTAKPFSWDASTSAISDELPSYIAGCYKSSIGIVRTTVAATAANKWFGGYRWEFKFDCPILTAFPKFQVVDFSLLPNASVSAVNITSTRTVLANKALEGSFRFALNGSSTAVLPVGGGLELFASAVTGLFPSGSPVQVECFYPTSVPSIWDSLTVFIYYYRVGNVPQIEVITDAVDPVTNVKTPLLTGENVTATVTTYVDGSDDPFISPIPMDFFQTGAALPAVEVISNGIMASCGRTGTNTTANITACTFLYDDRLTPIVTSVDKTQVTVGDVITINGFRFLDAASGIALGPGNTTLPVWQLNRVFLNDSECNVTSATSTVLTCTVQHAAVGTYDIRVEVGQGRGFALFRTAVDGNSIPAPTVVYAGRVDSVSPSTGSRAGGTLITIRGTGFRAYASENQVLVGGAVCAVETSSFSEIACRTPRAPNSRPFADAGFYRTDFVSETFTTESDDEMYDPGLGFEDIGDGRDVIGLGTEDSMISNSATPTRTPSSTVSRTVTPSMSMTRSVTASLTASRTVSATGTASKSVAATNTPSRTASVTISTTRMATMSLTASRTATVGQSISASPSPASSFATERNTTSGSGARMLGNVTEHTRSSPVRSFVSASPIPVGPAPPELQVEDVYVNGASSNKTFTFASSLTPVIQKIEPMHVSSGVAAVVNVTVLLKTSLQNVTISFGERACRVRETFIISPVVAPSTESVVMFSCIVGRSLAPALPQLPVLPFVEFPGLGYADPNGLRFDHSLRVDSLSAKNGSLEGGHLVRFFGAGISPILRLNTITFVHYDYLGFEFTAPCVAERVAQDGSWLDCRTSPVPYHRHDMHASSNATALSGTFEFSVNNITAQCAPGACSYSLAPGSTPVVQKLSLSDSGKRLVIQGPLLGTSFDAIVKLGHHDKICGDIKLIADRSGFTCALPPIAAGPTRVKVAMTSYGTARMDALSIDFGLIVLNITTPLIRDSAGVLRSSINGGLPIILQGLGFPDADDVLTRLSVRFGSQEALILHANNSHAVVLTPPLGTVPTSSVAVNLLVRVLADDGLTVMAGRQVVNALTYDVSETYTPRLFRIAPASGSMGSRVQVWGSGFGASHAEHDGSAILIGGAACTMDFASCNSTYMECIVGPTAAGTHRVLVNIAGKGLATHTGSQVITFTSALESASVSQTTSGVGGGAILTFTGKGFGSTLDAVRSYFNQGGMTSSMGLMDMDSHNMDMIGSIDPMDDMPMDMSSGALVSALAAGRFGNSSTAVKLCNTYCTVLSSNYTHLTCKTTTLIPQAALADDVFGTWKPAMLMGTTTGSHSSAALATDMNLATGFTSCRIDMDLGNDTRGVVTSVRYYPKWSATVRMRNAVFLASNVSPTGPFVTLATASQGVMAGWNEIHLFNGPGMNHTDLSNVPSYRYLRFAFADGVTDCSGQEIEFRGIPVAARSDASCPVTFNVTANREPKMFISTTLPAPVVLTSNLTIAFNLAGTPYIESISPTNGTALGGTLVRITGRNFGDFSDMVTVSLNGVPCAVQSARFSEVTCITGKRTEIVPLSLNLNVRGVGTAMYDASRTFFRYLDKWSALTTWKYNVMPFAGDTVYVPEGQSILVDISPPELFLVLVEGELVFDNKDLTFDAHYILVNGGKFLVGTEDVPFTNNLTITLHGDRYGSIEIPEVGAKVLAVMNKGGAHASHADDMMVMDGNGMMMGHSDDVMRPSFSEGILEIHGRPRKTVWTRIAVDAPAGTNILCLEDDADFQPGENLVIASTSHDYREAEELVVAEVINSKTYRLTKPLAFTHISQVFSGRPYGHRDVKMAAEVGLLSRNVVVQGDDRSESQLFGAHTGAFHGGIYRVENAEFRRCGQGFNLGRYCTHVHMLSDTNNYVRSNSIHHSFQRASTTHATNYFTVENNVAYLVRGHTFFLEDGVEKWNTLRRNLAISTIPSVASLKSDLKPASFWTASPTNYWIDNVSAGGSHDGVWFEPPLFPHGPSYVPDYCPMGQKVAWFFGHTSHSYGVHGLRIYPQYTPYIDPCRAESGSAPAYFHNLTSWRNGGHGIFGKVNGDLHHINPILMENLGDDYRQIKYEGGISLTWDPNIKNGLFVCAANPDTRCWNKKAIFAPQDEFWYVSGATFVGYRDIGAISGCTDCESDTEYAQGGYTIRFDGLRFVNTTRRVKWEPPKKDIFIDLDGSLTGFRNGTAMPFFTFNNFTGPCRTDTVGTYDKGIVCDGTVRVRRVQIDNTQPKTLDGVNLNVTSSAGSQVVQFRPKETYGWVYPAVTERRFTNTFVSLSDWQQMRIRYSEHAYFASRTNEWMSVTFPYIDYRYYFRVLYSSGQRASLPLQTSGSMAVALGPEHDFGTGTFPGGLSDRWEVVLSNKNINASDSEYNRNKIDVYAEQCPPNGCVVPGAGTLGNQTLWSDPKTWPSGKVPTLGQDVTILANMSVAMDISPPKLRNLVINGRLEFYGTGLRKLEADTIVVWGEWAIGSESSPYDGRAEIILHGVRSSTVVTATNELFLGNKVIACFGKMNFFGMPRLRSWTKLLTTAKRGSSVLELTHPVDDWYIGERIVIGSTDYDPNAVETATILAVTGNVVTLTEPLKFRHFAGFAATAGSANVTLRAPVGLLSRGITIRSNLLSSSDTYGGHVYVATVRRAENPKTPDVITVREGNANLQWVQFLNMGKQGMEYASLMIQHGYFAGPGGLQYFPVNQYGSNIQFCSFTDSFNTGIALISGRSTVLNGNVIHRTYRSAVDADKGSLNTTITNNFVAGNYRSPDVNADDQLNWVWPQAGIYIDTPAVIRGNVVSGGWDVGYTFRADSCSASIANPMFSNNEAVSVRIGVWILPGTYRCLFVGGATVWKASHIALVTVDQVSNVIASNFTISDSHIGVSFNFFKSSLELSYSTLKNSIIVGSSLATDACREDRTCRAANAFDVRAENCNSVLGRSFRAAGVLSPQYTNRGKTCQFEPIPCRIANFPERLCALPWEKRYGLPSTSATAFFMEGVTFSGFNDTGCYGESKAIVWNPTSVDMWVPMFVKKVTWDETPLPNRFHFRWNEQSDGKCQDNQGCGSLNFINIQDQDGSLTGVARTSVLGPNPAVTYSTPTCIYRDEWPGFECPGISYRSAVLQSTEREVANLRLGAMQITRRVNEQDNSTWRTSMSLGPIDDMCAKRFYFAHYPHMIEPGMQNDVFFPSTEPGRMRFYFLSDDPAESAVISLWVQRAYAWTIFMDGVELKPMDPAYKTDRPTLQNATGTYLFDPHARRLWFTVRGGRMDRVYDLVRTPTIMLNVKLAVTQEQFFGTSWDSTKTTLIDNLAMLLKIDRKRIKIVDVQESVEPLRRIRLLAGSASNGTMEQAINFQITDDKPPVIVDAANTTSLIAAKEQANRLTEVQSSITALAQNGNLNDLSPEFPIVDAAMIPAPPVKLPTPLPTAGDYFVVANSTTTSTNSSDTSSGNSTAGTSSSLDMTTLLSLYDDDPSAFAVPSSAPTPSNTPSPSVSASPSASVTPSVSPSVSVSQSPGAVVIPPSSTPTSSITRTSSRTGTSTRSVTPTPIETPTSTVSPSEAVRIVVASKSNTPTKSPSSSVSPSLTPTSSVSPTRTPSFSVSPSGTASSTVTSTRTPSDSRTPSATAASSVSATITSSATLTATLTPSISPSVSELATGTPSRSPSRTGSATTTSSTAPSGSATQTSTISAFRSGAPGGQVELSMTMAGLTSAQVAQGSTQQIITESVAAALNITASRVKITNIATSNVEARRRALAGTSGVTIDFLVLLESYFRAQQLQAAIAAPASVFTTQFLALAAAANPTTFAAVSVSNLVSSAVAVQPSPTASPSPSALNLLNVLQNADSGMSTGAVIGIAAGVVFGTALLFLFFSYLSRSLSNKAQQAKSAARRPRGVAPAPSANEAASTAARNETGPHAALAM